MTELFVLDDFVLLDGTGAAPLPSARVVVEDGVIVSVGDGTGRLGGARVVAGRGKWLLPDTHMHHAFSAGGLVSAEEFSEQQLLLNWRAYLRSGVTSVVSVGDDKNLVLAARAAEGEGTFGRAANLRRREFVHRTGWPSRRDDHARRSVADQGPCHRGQRSR